MVIDAMRFDFALQNDSMKYFAKLMKNDEACLFHLNVQPPTVTLPRIKVTCPIWKNGRLLIRHETLGNDHWYRSEFHRCGA